MTRMQMTDVQYLVVHHSLTKDSGTVSWGAIRNYHVNTLGWEAIGYHVGIELVGDRYERLLGRSLFTRGAHCKEARMNARSWGVCCIGNFDLEEPAKDLLDVLRETCWELMEISGGNIPVTHVIGHREGGMMAGYNWQVKDSQGRPQFKSCPGAKLDMDAFRATL